MLCHAGAPQAPQFTFEHPAVRTHPETRRESPFVKVSDTLEFSGMSEAERAPLLQSLFNHPV